MKKKKISLLTNTLIGLRKPSKKFTMIDNNSIKKNIYFINKDKFFDNKKEYSEKHIKKENIINLSNPIMKKQLTYLKEKKGNSNKINIKIKDNQFNSNNLFIGINNIRKKKSNNNFNNKSCHSNRSVSRNRLVNKNLGSIIKNNNYSFNLLTNRLNKKENKIIINKSNNSLNNLYDRYKNNKKYINSINNRKYRNINQDLKINEFNINNSNKNINTILRKKNDFKTINFELFKRKLKINQGNNTAQNFQNKSLRNICPTTQSSIKSVKKKAFLYEKTFFNSFELIKINNKLNKNNNNNKDILKNEKRIKKISKAIFNNTQKNITHSNSRNQLLNKNKVNKLNLFSNLNIIKDMLY